MHRVWVDDFLLGVFPVRNRDYQLFLEATAHPAPPLWNHPDFNHPDQPVAAVSWFEAVKYAEWLSSCLGKALPVAHRSRVGTRGARRPGGRALRLGR